MTAAPIIAVDQEHDTLLNFVFFDGNRRPFDITGMTIIAKLMNLQGTVIYQDNVSVNAVTNEIGTVTIPSLITLAMEKGLYTMELTVATDLNQEFIIRTYGALPRYTVELQ